MRRLPGVRMRRGAMRQMWRMRRMRHSSVQMRMRCRNCWLRSLWLQLRRLWRHLLDVACHRLGLGLLTGR